MKNLIQATILIMSVAFSNPSSMSDGLISGAVGYSYISLDKHPFLCKNKHLEPIRDCIDDLTEGYNEGYVGIFANLNGKRVDRLTLDYAYLNGIGVTSMIASVGVDPNGKVLLASLIKTNVELRESQRKRILKDLLKLKMLENKDANCIEWQQVRLDGLYLFGPIPRG